jgi:diaminopimelate decarboxylase
MPPKSNAYEAPRIEKLPFVTYGKHPDREVLSSADVADIPDAQAMVEEFGSPLFVVTESRLRHDFRRFQDAFTVSGMDTTVAYSIKTNYLPAVCATLKQEGAAAEVVSEMEYDLARALGYEGSEIIFNGPHKGKRALERAVGEGAVVNIDGFDELKMVSQIAASMGVKARVGLRMSFKYRGAGWTKFGFDHDAGDLHLALEQVAADDYLDLELLHNHCGTFVLNHDLYTQAIKRLIDGARHARDLGLSPRGVDVGGGFPSENAIKPEYDLPGGSRRKGDFWRPYADEICSSILDARELFGGRPRLILEPGRALVDASTQLLTTVVAKKSSDKDVMSVIVDAGVNLLPTSIYYDHPLTRVE